MKKALVLFGNEENTHNLIKSCIYLKEKFGYNLNAILVRDVITETMSMGQGLIANVNYPLFVDDMIKIEKEELKSLVEELKEEKLKIDLTYEIGIISETIREYMKSYDLLVLGKGVVASDILMDVLKENYKATLILGEEELKFSDIYIANDDSIEVNRSCYSFIRDFPEIKEFISVQENSSEENKLNEYLISKQKKIEVKKFSDSKSLIEFVKNVENNGVTIMGNLSRNYFVEKIMGRSGLKILEKAKMAIYIG